MFVSSGQTFDFPRITMPAMYGSLKRQEGRDEDKGERVVGRETNSDRVQLRGPLAAVDHDSRKDHPCIILKSHGYLCKVMDDVYSAGGRCRQEKSRL